VPSPNQVALHPKGPHPKGRKKIDFAQRVANRRGVDPAPKPPPFVSKKRPVDSPAIASRSDVALPPPPTRATKDKPATDKQLAAAAGGGAQKPIDPQDLAWRVLPANGSGNADRSRLVPRIDLPPAPDFGAAGPAEDAVKPPFAANLASVPLSPSVPTGESVAQLPPGAAPPASESLGGTSLAPPRSGTRQDSAAGVFRRELAAKPISLVSIDITPASGDFPGEVRLPSDPTGDAPPIDSMATRGWAHSGYSWEATGLYHRPLYFEQPNLERYGYAPTRSRTGQSILAGAHFFGSVLILPYRLGAEPINDAVYTLGHYRPGSCVPYRFVRPPLDWKAGALETVTIVGLIFAIP
jgi:hypothetical protein